MVVIAGPGTGKTATIVERMVGLLREEQSREVTFLTFTRASRRDCERKLVRALGDEVLSAGSTEFPRVSTLHRYAKRLVHRYGYLIDQDPNFSVPIEAKGERDLIIEEALQDLTLGLPVDQAAGALAARQATGDWPAGLQMTQAERMSLLERYGALLSMYSALDMERVMLAACEILGSGMDAIPQVFLQMDEYQDLNPTDQRFIDLLSSHRASEIVVVGDDAQSIYGTLRHAHLEGIQGLWNDESWARQLLPDSHRLPGHVLNASLALIASAGYLGSQINRKPSNGLRIPTLRCTSSGLQVEAIAADIRATLASTGESGDQSRAYSSFLVLCPTRAFASAMARGLTEGFNIPTRMFQRPSIPENVWVLILLLRIICRNDPLALRQWLPRIGYSRSDLTKIRRAVMATRVDYYDHCMSLRDERMDLLRDGIARVSTSLDSVESLVEAMSDVCESDVSEGVFEHIEHEHGEAETQLNLGQILERLYELSGLVESDEAAPEEDAVLVTTLYSAKGLEAEVAYCPWMDDRFMPMPSSDVDEQRRLLYVAMTRAKSQLVLLFHERFERGRGRLRNEVLSPFLHEIRQHLEIVPVNAEAVRSENLPWR